jgi:hypothetical protein
MIAGMADALTLPREIAEALRRVPELACAAFAPGDDGDDLWLIADAEPVTAGRALIPIVGELLRAHPGLIADFHILPTGGRLPSTLLPAGARTLLLRRVEAEDA